MAVDDDGINKSKRLTLNKNLKDPLNNNENYARRKLYTLLKLANEPIWYASLMAICFIQAMYVLIEITKKDIPNVCKLNLLFFF